MGCIFIVAKNIIFTTGFGASHIILQHNVVKRTERITKCPIFQLTFHSEKSLFVYIFDFVIERERGEVCDRRKSQASTWFSSAKKTDSFFQFSLVNIVIFILPLVGRNIRQRIFFDGERESFLMPRAERPCTWSKATHHNKIYTWNAVNFCLPSNWTKEKQAGENAAETLKTIKTRVCEYLSVFGKFKKCDIE